jgi:hypothetical protein
MEEKERKRERFGKIKKKTAPENEERKTEVCKQIASSIKINLC